MRGRTTMWTGGVMAAALVIAAPSFADQQERDQRQQTPQMHQQRQQMQQMQQQHQQTQQMQQQQPPQQRPGRRGDRSQDMSRQRDARTSDMLADRIVVALIERGPYTADMRVLVDNGTVTLTGTVPSEDAKRRAVRVARRTAGVEEVRDQLRVDPRAAATASSAPSVPDAELAKRVAQQIASTITGAKAGEDWWFSGWRVEGPDNRWNMVVEASDGIVWLEGDVPRLDIVRKAMETARQVPGVRGLRTDLEIESYPYYGGAPYRYHPYAYYPYPPFARPYGIYGDPYDPAAASPRTEPSASGDGGPKTSEQNKN